MIDNITFLVIGFFLGFFFHKKIDTIKTFFRSLKYLYSMSNEKKIYNEFFETDFNESDYIKERKDIENV